MSATAGQEAFFEGHAHTFDVLGGVPAGKIRYDNLKATVASVGRFGRQRGETDRWVALGTEAAIAGHRVKHALATELANELVEAADELLLSKTIARYGHVDLLCIDELDYMQLDRRGAEILFQVLTESEERNSVVIASNESCAGWTKTFTALRLCAATIETGTDSCRLAHARQALAC